MNIAVTIGGYRLAAFIELNIRACRFFIGQGTPVLVHDSPSPESPRIERLAAELDADYIRPEGRRSHFNGDMSATVSAIRYAADTGADIAVKLSQRLVPASGGFAASIEDAFADTSVAVALPGRPVVSPRFRPRGVFYSRFPVLTDVVALRANVIHPDELWALYAERVEACRSGPSGPDKTRALTRQHVEVFWWELLQSRFAGKHRVVDLWANPRPMQPKLCLRKTQSTSHEYSRLAAALGMDQAVFDLREWSEIEKSAYYCHATAA